MSHSLIYIITEGIVRGIPFLTLPIFISLLTKEEYGIMSLYLSLLPLLAIIFDLSQRVSIKRFYYEYPKQLDNFVFTIILSILFITFLIGSIVFIFHIEIVKSSNNLLILINIAIYTIIEQLLSKYQITKQIKFYNVYFLFRNAMPYIVAILLLYSVVNNHLSIIYAQLLIFTILLLALIFNFIKTISFKSIKLNFIKYIKYSLSIAIPVLPVVASAYILAVSDRYMIEHFFSYVEVAEYSVAYTIAMIVQLFVIAVGKAWQPFIFENLKINNISNILKHGIYYTLFICIVSIFIYIFAKQLILFLSNETYISVLDMIPNLLLGMFFFFLYSMVSNVAFYYKKMFLFGLPAMIAAVSNIILNYLFLPIYGYKIAAFTTMISYAIEFFVITLVIVYIYTLNKKGKI